MSDTRMRKKLQRVDGDRDRSCVLWRGWVEDVNSFFGLVCRQGYLW